MTQINRTKKELAFANKQLAASRATGFEEREPEDMDKTIKMVETVGIQKRALEEENEELKSRISELVAERDSIYRNTRKRFEEAENMLQNGVPSLNLTTKSRKSL